MKQIMDNGSSVLRASSGGTNAFAMRKAFVYVIIALTTNNRKCSYGAVFR